MNRPVIIQLETLLEQRAALFAYYDVIVDLRRKV